MEQNLKYGVSWFLREEDILINRYNISTNITVNIEIRRRSKKCSAGYDKKY